MNNSEIFKVTTPSDRTIVMTRTFDGPRKLLFDALTSPELLKRWLSGPPGWSLVECEVDLKVGGSYRYVWQGPNGAEIGMRGVYRDILPPERIVQTESFDQSWYPGEAVGTVVLAESGGKTTLTTTMLYESTEIRDSVLKTPMEQGVAASYDKLAQLFPPLP